MTETEVQQFMRIVRWRLRDCEQDRDYEDILAEGYYWAYRAYRNALANQSDNPMAVVSIAARSGLTQWRRRWYGDRRRTYQREREPDMPLTELVEGSLRIPTSRFDTDVIKSIWAEQVLELLAERCTPRQWETIEQVVIEGKAIKDVAEEMGVGIAAVCMNLRRAGQRVAGVLRSATHD